MKGIGVLWRLSNRANSSIVVVGSQHLKTFIRPLTMEGIVLFSSSS